MQLYLGLDPSHFPKALHYPVIRTELIVGSRVQEALSFYQRCTHALFTSKSCVRYWCEVSELKQDEAIAIGRPTASLLRKQGAEPLVSSVETQEGMIELLKSLPLENASIFYPHSKKARPLLAQYLQSRKISFFSFDLYDTIFQTPKPIPSLAQIDEIIFTSPSTVEGFLRVFQKIPRGKKLICIGPVTERALKEAVFIPSN